MNSPKIHTYIHSNQPQIKPDKATRWDLYASTITSWWKKRKVGTPDELTTVGGSTAAEAGVEARALKPMRKAAAAARWTSRPKCLLKVSVRDNSGKNEFVVAGDPSDAGRRRAADGRNPRLGFAVTSSLRSHREGDVALRFWTRRWGWGTSKDWRRATEYIRVSEREFRLRPLGTKGLGDY